MAHNATLRLVGTLCIVFLRFDKWSLTLLSWQVICSVAECPAGFYHSLESEAAICRKCDVCPPDFRVKVPCSLTANTLCSACPVGQFFPGNGSASCVPCTKCEAGSYSHKQCSENTDTECRPCEGRTYSSNDRQECLQCSTCSEGQYETRQCNGRHDTECRDCAQGHYTMFGKVCQACFTCPAGMGLKKACTKSSDTECGKCLEGTFSPGGESSCQACSQCHENQTLVFNCKLDKDTVCFPCQQGQFFDNASMECKTCTACRAGTVLQAECTATNNTVCSLCPNGTFSDTDGLTCRNCSKCPEGWRMISTCSRDADTVCRPCPKSTFFSTAINDCQQCSFCPAGKETKEACTKERDTTCQRCQDGYYSPGSGFSCRRCSLCPPGMYVKKECTRRRDTTCSPCPEGTYTLTQSSLTECLPCGTCQAPEAVLQPCYHDSNIRCGLCTSDRFKDAKTGECLRCSFCYPTHPGVAVREEGCRNQPENWQCRPLSSTPNASFKVLYSPQIKDSQTVHEISGPDTMDSLQIILVPTLVGVIVILTAVIAVSYLVRRQTLHLSSSIVQSCSSKTPQVHLSDTESDVRLWLSKQEVRHHLLSSSKYISWPLIAARNQSDNPETMSVVSHSAAFCQDKRRRLEDELSGDSRLYPKMFEVQSDSEPPSLDG